MAALLPSLFRYKAWANQELAAAIGGIDAAAHEAERRTAIRILNHTHVVDRIFGGDVRTPAPAMEFPLRGSSRVTDIESLYGITIGLDGERTLSEFMRERIGRPARVGDSVRLGSVVLSAREVVDGRVTTVGLSIVSEPQ